MLCHGRCIRRRDCFEVERGLVTLTAEENPSWQISSLAHWFPHVRSFFNIHDANWQHVNVDPLVFESQETGPCEISPLFRWSISTRLHQGSGRHPSRYSTISTNAVQAYHYWNTALYHSFFFISLILPGKYPHFGPFPSDLSSRQRISSEIILWCR